jgi:hypothetical protein
MGQRAWYFVCDCCNAKWFAEIQEMECPRCGRSAVSSERHVPPWIAAPSLLKAKRPSSDET